MKRNITALVDLMRNRTTMYIGENSIKNFGMFLRGYSFAVYDREEYQGYSSDLKLFTKWLEKKHSIIEASLGWDYILLKIARDEESALDLFWKEWDEFQAEKPLN